MAQSRLVQIKVKNPIDTSMYVDIYARLTATRLGHVTAGGNRQVVLPTYGLYYPRYSYSLQLQFPCFTETYTTTIN